MTRLPRVVWAMVRAEMTANAAYRAQIVLSAFGWVVPLVMLVIWQAATAERSDVTVGQVTAYFLVALLLTSINPMGQLVFGYGELVHSGQMSALLLRPVHPAWGQLAKSIARVVNSLVASSLLIAVIVWRSGITVRLDAATLGWAMLCWIVGLVGVGFLSAVVGCISFWTTRAEGMQSLTFAIDWLLGGLSVPFALIGGRWAELAILQPFWLALGAPAELVSGLREPGSGLVGPLAVGVVWAVALFALHRVVWALAVRRHEAVGT